MEARNAARNAARKTALSNDQILICLCHQNADCRHLKSDRLQTLTAATRAANETLKMKHPFLNLKIAPALTHLIGGLIG